jgi:hypothetical protein
LWYYRESRSFPKSRAQKMSGGAAGGGAAPQRIATKRVPPQRGEQGANTIRQLIFKIGSNFFENVHIL